MKLPPSNVDYLECSFSKKLYEPSQLYNLPGSDRPLIVHYDLQSVNNTLTKSDLAKRQQNIWRYRELLPVPPGLELISLGENWTPLIKLSSIPSCPDKAEILIKDETRMPLGTITARDCALAVTMAKALGVEHISIQNDGNEGPTLAAYCCRAGLKATVVCSEKTPDKIVREMTFHGAIVHRIRSPINQLDNLLSENEEANGHYDITIFREPYRLEGRKTLGFELAEQLGWKLPDLIFYPTSNGAGLVALWKAFNELEEIGWIGAQRPRMIAVQPTGCAPIVKAFEDRKVFLEQPWEKITTKIQSLQVSSPRADFLSLQVIQDSGGFGVTISDEEAIDVRNEIGLSEGIKLGLEGALCVAAYRKMLLSNMISKRDQAVILNTAKGD